MPFEIMQQRLLFALVGGAAIFWGAGADVSAQAPAPPDNAPTVAEHTVMITSQKTSLEIVEHSAKLIEAPTKLKRVFGFDPEIIDVKAITPTRVHISALAQGSTTIVLTGENDRQFSVEVFVKGDARHVQAIINNRYPDSSVEAMKVQDSVVLSGWVSQPDHITQIVEIADQFYPKVLNHMRVGGVQQVKLKCKVMEVQRSKLRRMGFNFAVAGSNSTFASNVGELSSFIPATTTSAARLAGSAAAPSTNAFSTVGNTASFAAFFDALKQENLLKILAEPTIVTTNGRVATMDAGGEFPLPVSSGLGTTTIEWKQFGVHMEAVPIVVGAGRIRMEVMPRVSDRDVASGVTFNGSFIPGITTRSVNTQVEMRVGETLMLAGLLSWKQQATTQKTPFLGELPYVGAFFRRVKYEDVETELVILLTPELVAPLDPSSVPQGGPGGFTDKPTDRELFSYGLIEVPNYGSPCNQCQDQSCPQCRKQKGHFSPQYNLPIHETREPVSYPADVRELPVPAAPLPGESAGLRSGNRSKTTSSGTQQVGHTQTVPKSYSTPSTAPSSTPSSRVSPRPSPSVPPKQTVPGKSSTRPTTRNRPGLIEP